MRDMMNPSVLLPGELRQAIPPLGTTEGVADPLVMMRLLAPDSIWTWYVIEFDGDDQFFGYVAGETLELGHFTLAELLAVRGPYGLRVERDTYFTPRPLSTVRRWHESV